MKRIFHRKAQLLMAVSTKSLNNLLQLHIKVKVVDVSIIIYEFYIIIMTMEGTGQEFNGQPNVNDTSSSLSRFILMVGCLFWIN